MTTHRSFLGATLAAGMIAASAYTGCGGADGTSPFTSELDGGGAAGQGPDVTGDQPCKTSLDCAGRPNAETVCDRGTGECVQCMAAPDCEPNHDCINRRCVPFTPCNSSLDCPTGQVCDGVSGRCVECVRAADCGADRTCAGNRCRDRCDSDNDCTPFQLLCDTAGGHCVECLSAALCRADEHCREGVCVPDVCTAGQKSCQNAAIVTCSEAGDGYGAPVPCAAGQTCDPTPSGVSCHSGDAGAGGSGGVGGTGSGGDGGVGGSSGSGGTAGAPTDARPDASCTAASSSCGSCLCQNCSSQWQACLTDPENTPTSGCYAMWQCVDRTGCRGIPCLGGGPCTEVFNASAAGNSLSLELALSQCVDGAGCPCNRSGTGGTGGAGGRGGTGGVAGTSGRGGTGGSGGTSGRGGTGGSGGTGGTCNLSGCSNLCIPVLEERCCTPAAGCGCKNVSGSAACE